MNNKMAIQILRGDVLGTDEQTHEAVFMAIKALKEQERVDAVPVVRCKDCQYYHIYWESDGHTEKGYGACDWINDNSVREDHFCSWGERRGDVQESD